MSGLTGCDTGAIISPGSPIPRRGSMDDLGRSCEGISPISPRTPTGELFCESTPAPSRPTVTEERLLVDVTSTPYTASFDEPRNGFVLVAPREISSRFVVRLSPRRHNSALDEESQFFDESTSLLDSNAISRDSELHGLLISSPREARLTRTSHLDEPVHNISTSIQESSCIFAPIQRDDGDGTFDDDLSESDDSMLEQIRLQSRTSPSDFCGDEMSW
jgi:hypothetical protein